MKLLVMNQFVPKLARPDELILTLQKPVGEVKKGASQEGDSFKMIPKNEDEFPTLARLKYPNPPLDDTHPLTSEGDIRLLGGLAIAALSSNNLASFFGQQLFPWRHHVDLLLITGTLEKEIDLRQLNAALLPSLIFFSRDEEISENKIKKDSGTTRLIDLGRKKNQFFGIDYHPDEKSDTLSLTRFRKGLFGRKRPRHEAFSLDKYGKILFLLEKYYREIVTGMQKSYNAQNTGNEQIPWAAVEGAITNAAEYLDFLHRHPDVSRREKEEMLTEILRRKMNPTIRDLLPHGGETQIRRIILENIKALALYLEAWGLREDEEILPSSGPYR